MSRWEFFIILEEPVMTVHKANLVIFRSAGRLSEYFADLISFFF